MKYIKHINIDTDDLFFDEEQDSISEKIKYYVFEYTNNRIRCNEHILFNKYDIYFIKEIGLSVKLYIRDYISSELLEKSINEFRDFILNKLTNSLLRYYDYLSDFNKIDHRYLIDMVDDYLKDNEVIKLYYSGVGISFVPYKKGRYYGYNYYQLKKDNYIFDQKPNSYIQLVVNNKLKRTDRIGYIIRFFVYYNNSIEKKIKTIKDIIPKKLKQINYIENYDFLNQIKNC